METLRRPVQSLFAMLNRRSRMNTLSEAVGLCGGRVHGEQQISEYSETVVLGILSVAWHGLDQVVFFCLVHYFLLCPFCITRSNSNSLGIIRHIQADQNMLPFHYIEWMV
jgi:hypothetical protein